MAITRGNIGEYSSGTATVANGATIPIPVPAGVVAGDYVLVAINFSAGTSPPTAPAALGSPIETITGAGIGNGLRVYGRVIDGTEGANFNFTSTAVGYVTGTAVCYHAVDTSSPVDVHNQTAGTSTTGSAITVPDITPTGTGRALVGFTGAYSGAGAIRSITTDLPSYTRVSTNPAGNSEMHVATWERLGQGASATGTLTGAWSGTGMAYRHGVQIALRPAAAAPIALTTAGAAGVVFGTGPVPLAVLRAFVAAGGAVFGSGPDALLIDHGLVAAGGPVFGGAASLGLLGSIDLAAAGGFAFDGAAVLARDLPLSADGSGVVFGGAADLTSAVYNALEANGGILIRGAADMGLGFHAFNAAGGIQIGTGLILTYEPGGIDDGDGMGTEPGQGFYVLRRPRHWAGIREGDWVSAILPPAGINGSAPLMRLIERSYKSGEQVVECVWQHLADTGVPSGDRSVGYYRPGVAQTPARQIQQATRETRPYGGKRRRG